MQQDFSWRQVGLAALGGAVSGALGGIPGTDGITQVSPGLIDTGTFARVDTLLGLAQRGGQAMLGNAITQGLSVASGLQDRYQWRQVAASAFAAPVGQLVGSYAAPYMNSFGASLAGGLTSGLIRSAIYNKGKVDYASIAADAFGNAVGNGVVEGIQEQTETGRENYALVARGSSGGLRLGSGEGLRLRQSDVDAFDQRVMDGIAQAQQGTADDLNPVSALPPAQFAERFGPAAAYARFYAGEVTDIGMNTLGAAAEVLSVLPFEAMPTGIMTDKHRAVAARNMEVLLGREQRDVFDYMLATQTPGMMKTWVLENRDLFARSFAGPLSINELGYMGQFLPENVFARAEALSPEGLNEARRLYGDVQVTCPQLVCQLLVSESKVAEVS